MRVGLVGCGAIALRHYGALMEDPRAELVAVCDRVEEQIDWLFERASDIAGPRPARYGETAELYSRERLDAVVIATPHAAHRANILEALDAGLHVLVEKPMVTSVGDALEIRDRLDRGDRVLAVGNKTPVMGTFRLLRAMMRDGRLGALSLASGYISQGWRGSQAGRWRQDPAVSGGGMAYDSGSHLINSLLWAVESDPVEVVARADHCGLEVDVNSAALIRFANGTMATLAIGGDTLGSMGSFLVFLFERGRVEIDGVHGRWMRVFDENGEVSVDPDLGRLVVPTTQFITAVLDGERPATGVEEAIRQSRFMEAFYRSAEDAGQA